MLQIILRVQSNQFYREKDEKSAFTTNDICDNFDPASLLQGQIR